MKLLNLGHPKYLFLLYKKEGGKNEITESKVCFFVISELTKQADEGDLNSGDIIMI